MRAVVFTLLCIAAAVASAATIYKWVDENGVTHYSDQPHPGAQKMQVQPVQTYKSPVQRTSPSPSRAGAAAPAGPAYSVCIVSRPTSEEMFLNTQTVPASVHVEPGLRPGDRISVLLDGKPVSTEIPLDRPFMLTSVYRGAHSLAVKIEDASGTVVCESPSVPFNVRQPSVLAPNSPLNRPR